MTNPLEVLFSVYLVAHPPFFARLSCRKYSVSDRIDLFCYAKVDGNLVKCDLIKKRRRSFDITSGDNIRAITVVDPNSDLDSILSIPDSDTILYFSGYQWKWTPDHAFVRAIDGASAFYLTADEASRVRDMINSDKQCGGNDG